MLFWTATKNIFKDNKYHDKNDGYFENPILTFKTEEFFMPKNDRRILIVGEDSPIKEENTFTLPGYKFGHQSLRFYFSNKADKTREAFRILEDLTKREDLFDKKMPDRVGGDNMEKYGKEVASYLEIMGKIDSENIYSNLLAFFLNYDRDLLEKFCKKICNINIQKNKAKIQREKHGRTDIWIEDDKNVIVIENKIKAGLSQPKQLKKYKRQAKKDAKGRNIALRLIAPNYYNGIEVVMAF